MSATSWTIFAVFAAIAIAWITRTWRRNTVPVHKLVSRVDPKLATSLYPLVYIEGQEPVRNDGYLISAIGGLQGIARMHHDAGVFVTLAIRIRKAYPDDTSVETREMFRNAIYLRLSTWLSMLEGCAALIWPSLPRVQARSCASLYCEIATSLDVVLSIIDTPSTGSITEGKAT